MLENLKKELKEAVSKHYEYLKKSFTEETLYGYSLYTSEDVPDLYPVANKLSAIEVDKADAEYCYYRYCPNEWSDWDDFGMFSEVNEIITELYQEMNDDFLGYKKGVLRQAMQALLELESEGLFGEKNDERFLIVFLSDSANDIMNISAKELNTSNVYEEFTSIL